MWIQAVVLIVSLFVLAWSADKFVDGSCGLAKYFGISPFLIGMVIVGFGTSAPEMLVSATSALEGSPSIALGNAYGSNIANIALILGVAAIVNPIKVDKSLLKKELPFLLFTIPLTVLLILDGEISRIDAVILLAVFLVIMVVSSLGKKEEISEEGETGEKVSILKSLFFLVLGLTLLVSSSKALVWAAKEIAEWLGISELIIGLTIIALGTSLPELASSVSAARKNEHEVAFGNVVGSNLFNTLCVVGIAAAIKPVLADPKILLRDIPIVSVLTLLLFVFAARQKIGRFSGVLLLILYFAYNTLLSLKII
ncbi:calcium/sodium antiporter [bacterium]|nr:calcium/sodium antiporter [bacterium]